MIDTRAGFSTSRRMGRHGHYLRLILFEQIGHAYGRIFRVTQFTPSRFAALAQPGIEFRKRAELATPRIEPDPAAAVLHALLRRQHAFGHQLLQLPRQARFTQDGLGVFVLNLGDQLIQQFGRSEIRRFLLFWFFDDHCIGRKISLRVLFHDPGHTKNLTPSSGTTVGSPWLSDRYPLHVLMLDTRYPSVIRPLSRC